MRALTLHRPWPLPVVHGIKPIENRGWRPWPGVIGTRIGIHAGQQRDEDAARKIRELWPDLDEHEDTPGVIVGSAIVAGWVMREGQHCWTIDTGIPNAVHPNRLGPPLPHAVLVQIAEGNVQWFIGPIGWILVEARAYPRPVPHAGAQGIWQVSVAAEELCRVQEIACGGDGRFEGR